MPRLLSDIDQLLRGGFTRSEDLSAGKVSLPARTLMLGSLVLGCTYGAFMGIYGVTRPDNPAALQLLATTLKVPLLFLLTLVVSFPSLYVLSALAGSRLRFRATLRLLLAAIAVNLAGRGSPLTVHREARPDPQEGALRQCRRTRVLDRGYRRTRRGAARAGGRSLSTRRAV